MNIKSSIACGLLTMVLYGCSLDYTNTGTIRPDNGWTDKAMISAFLADIEGGMKPGWPLGDANNSDEGMNGNASMTNYQRGEISVDNNGQGLSYGNIDKINFFLKQIENVDLSVLTEVEKREMVGQALFWRAWAYWGMVNVIGGVPLILEPQDVTNVESLFRSRNSTSECMAQIFKDLDDAISMLPDEWTGTDYGRIDKGCAMAYKGRLMMWWASPLFNPSNNQERWQAAYEANKEAVEFLRSQGKGLYQGKFEDIWYDERNCEVVMVNQFYYPDHTFNQNLIRPLRLTKDNSNNNQAILPLLLAYPKKDGTKLTLDTDRLATDPAYNAQFVDEFYLDRDPRFYATIFSPGTVYPVPDLTGGQRYWPAWKKVENPDDPKGFQYASMVKDQLGDSEQATNTCFHQLKGLDKTLTIALVGNAAIDWIEIRFAEVLLNYGECANEIGKTAEALQVLYDIRKRAGIENKDGKYGITASATSEIRQAYIDERFIELAYEGKRWGDLRRWKRFDILNNLKHRNAIWLIAGQEVDPATFDWTNDMSDPEVRKMFSFDFIECPEGDKSVYKFNLSMNHWFYPIKKNDLDRNSKLEQNNEWGGTFDPLK